MSPLLLLLLVIAANDPEPATRIDEPGDGRTPSLELLEFLGSFESIDGDWIDPMSFEEQYENKTKAQADETNSDKDRSRDPDPARVH